MSLKIQEVIQKDSLSRCPFCGGTAQLVKYESKKMFNKTTAYLVECEVCKIRTHVAISPQEVERIWNKRFKDAYINYL